ncbi:hypothetical protein ACLQ28_21590 [Micromonospora sp. DT201]
MDGSPHAQVSASNATGHQVLGQCLSGAAATAARAVSCVRAGNGTISVS